MCGKGLVQVVWDVGDEGADVAIVEVYGVDVSDSNTANTGDDYIVFVASVGADEKVAGTGDAVEDRAGVLSTRVWAGVVNVASIVSVTTAATPW